MPRGALSELNPFPKIHGRISIIRLGFLGQFSQIGQNSWLATGKNSQKTHITLAKMENERKHEMKSYRDTLQGKLQVGFPRARPTLRERATMGRNNTHHMS